jgi:hypothetical protein
MGVLHKHFKVPLVFTVDSKYIEACRIVAEYFFLLAYSVHQ